MPENPPIIRIDNVSFSHEHTEVLRAINFWAHPGEVIALLGRNGAGKSTLFRIIAGAWKPDSGTVFLNEQPYSYHRAGRDRVRRAIQLVLQEPDEQIFSTTVSADVSYGPINLGLSEEEVAQRVESALIRTGLVEYANHVPHHLSFGQRKRVSLAGALAMQPAVLVLDEPTAGLDPEGQEAVRGFIDELAQAGTTIIFATHNVDFAYEIADRVAILTDGTLRMGETRTILADQNLLTHAGLTVPWALRVSEILGRDIRRVADLVEKTQG
ncbi:energy-coupling factor ABC transporter ATP-binding protein [Corynebacterium sp. sy039]|uniref:energy-coupling factor ABC transporter ATP-binding protein n=1 Tax=Corynebacterium sp. sy039 TaxID=2599641 RepID=UPI0011B442B7|nr:ABC transporter ATP-binding protein [Corynebacterium sp. sy039]QDZ43420.1 ABC transporter ATP-binding protein [Corynebacterium sp. sy039]